MQPQSSNDPEDGNDGRVLPGVVHDSASGTSGTSYTTLAGDGHAASEVRVTSIRLDGDHHHPPREALSEKGDRIREDAPVVLGVCPDSPTRATIGYVHRPMDLPSKGKTQAPTEHAQQADGSVEPRLINRRSTLHADAGRQLRWKSCETRRLAQRPSSKRSARRLVTLDQKDDQKIFQYDVQLRRMRRLVPLERRGPRLSTCRTHTNKTMGAIGWQDRDNDLDGLGLTHLERPRSSLS